MKKKTKRFLEELEFLWTAAVLIGLWAWTLYWGVRALTAWMRGLNL